MNKLLSLLFVLFCAVSLSAQTGGKKTAAKKPIVKKNVAAPNANLPKVTQVDAVALQNLLKRSGENSKPLLVNFWATWCAPCLEEFPDLVKINNDYNGKIDFITVSLDDPAEINTGVPRFLAKVKATMPTYLLKTADEDAAITAISKDWQGGLPFTILYDGKGAVVYNKQAKFVPDVLRKQIDEILDKQSQQSAFERGKSDAQKDISEGRLIYKLFNYSQNERNDITIKAFQKNHDITIQNFITFPSSESFSYVKAYNLVSESKILEKQAGKVILRHIKNRFPINQPANVIELALTKK
jgi:thiol-disulfide isomerase/thioredoxin